MYIVESRFTHIETKESTEIHKENDVYQYSYDSPPIQECKLRLDNEVIEVDEIISVTEDVVEFYDPNHIRYKWYKRE